jgi:uncharacterized protein YbaR (Trm112 family)/SAM-dependent methyltransferase
MKPRLVKLMVCPLDRTELEVVEWESRPRHLSRDETDRARHLGIEPADLCREIMTGVLLNRAGKIAYPIYGGIPRMLVFETGVSREFWRKHGDRIRGDLPGFRPPDCRPMSGEKEVLRTFSSEWTHYGWNGQSYWNMTPDALHRAMRFLLDLDRRPLAGKRVLEVGIGIGSIADYVARTQECELVGVDLSHAVDAAFAPFGNNGFLHIVQASAFQLPFRERSFDFVYSQGVLHHTHSTKAAFECISQLPTIGGRLFVWVYSPADETRTLQRRVLMRLETVVRPFCSRLPDRLQAIALLPFVPLYLLHQNILRGEAGPQYVKYGWREAMHAARDRFTPRFAHRHSEEEVAGWFREASYAGLEFVSRRERPGFVPVSFVACTGIDGVREQHVELSSSLESRQAVRP